MSAPKIGPVPAMLRSWIKNDFHFFMGTQSTPSFMAIAGVCLSSGAKTFSVSLP